MNRGTFRRHTLFIYLGSKESRWFNLQTKPYIQGVRNYFHIHFQIRIAGSLHFHYYIDVSAKNRCQYGEIIFCNINSNLYFEPNYTYNNNVFLSSIFYHYRSY